MMNVNSGAVTVIFLALFAVGWGTQGYEVGNAIANERIFAEFVGVAIAIIAVAAKKSLWTRIRLTANEISATHQMARVK
ncbi:MAG: hypothetical protein GY906_18230 [bacterium]|nr:hypothetical protein [bacterium]